MFYVTNYYSDYGMIECTTLVICYDETFNGVYSSRIGCRNWRELCFHIKFK